MFASFIQTRLGGRSQLVGYDRTSLGGWDPATGKRLWKLVPPAENDFNVPTPVDYGEQFILSTESNGTRVYAFDADGRIKPKP